MLGAQLNFMNIYLACGLTHVPRSRFHSYVNLIHDIAQKISTDSRFFVKYALRDSDPQLADKPIQDRARLCYGWDRQMVEWADVLIAEATYPSTGLGIELQIAENKNIPIILCFNADDSNKAEPVDYETLDHSQHTLQLGEGYVTLMALGLPCLYRILKYSDGNQMIHELIEIIDTLNY